MYIERRKKLSTFFEEVESVKILIKLVYAIIHLHAFLQSKKKILWQYLFIKNMFAKFTSENMYCYMYMKVIINVLPSSNFKLLLW